MKLTRAQQNELEIWEYFMPKHMGWSSETDEDIKMFFEWSERGLHKDIGSRDNLSYFEALRQGKRWAGIHMEMYEDGVLNGTMPYYIILGGQDKEIMPRNVVDFIKKEMFRGIDREIIEKTYQEIINQMTLLY